MISSGIFWKLAFSISCWGKFIIFSHYAILDSVLGSLLEHCSQKQNPLWASNQSQFQSVWLPKRPRKNNLSSLFMLARVIANSSHYLHYGSDWKDKFGNNIFFPCLDMEKWPLICGYRPYLMDLVLLSMKKEE